MATTFKIVVKSGEEIEKIYLLDKPVNTIGRDPNNEIVIDDIEISRNHLKINVNENLLLIEDLNSTNGTFLNGKRIQKVKEVTDGDLISLGKNIVLEVVREKVDEDPQNQKMEEFEPLSTTAEETAKPFDQVTMDQIPKEPEPIVDDSFGNDILEQEEESQKDGFSENSSSKPKSKLQKMPTWTLVLVIALGFLVIFCLIPLLVIEVTNQWCNLFSGFFNSMSPGVCP